MSGDLQIVLFALLLSVVYSGSESVFYSVNRLKIEVLRRRGRKGAEQVGAYLDHPERYLATILVGNNIANILFGSFAAVYLSTYFNEAAVSLISTAVILLFGEILPKSLLRAVAEPAALRLVKFIRFSEILFAPFIRILSMVTQLLSRMFGISGRARGPGLSREDIHLLFRESRAWGHIEYADEQLVRRIMHLSAIRVRQIMVPRTEIEAVAADTTLEELQELFTRTRYTRLPVYEDTLDRIIGVIYVMDILRRPKNVRDLIREVPVVPESKSVLALLSELRRRRASLAVVIDEYGGTAGLVTLEDIMEEIFGEIADEYDYENRGIQRLNGNEFLVSGRVEVKTVNEELGLGLPAGDYETIAGYVIHELRRIPKPGERLERPGYDIIVESGSPQKIDRVRIVQKKG